MAQPTASPAKSMKRSATIISSRAKLQRHRDTETDRHKSMIPVNLFPDSSLCLCVSVVHSSFRYGLLSRSENSKKRQRRRQDYVQDGDGQKELPAETHQLVETKARQRAAQPDIKKQEEDNLN